MRLVAEAGASIIECPSIDTEPLGIGSVIFTKPLEVGDTLVCTGTYTLTSDDVENLRRESLVTVEAMDEEGYHVGMSVPRTVPLYQASNSTPLGIALAVTTKNACNVSSFSLLVQAVTPPRKNLDAVDDECCLIWFGDPNAFQLMTRRVEHIVYQVPQVHSHFEHISITSYLYTASCQRG